MMELVRQFLRILLPLRTCLLLCLSCLVFLLYVTSDRISVTTSSASKLRTALVFSDVSLLTSSSFIKSIKDSDDEFRMLRVEGRVLFPDHVLLLTLTTEEMECVYNGLVNGTTLTADEVVTSPVVSIDEYDEVRSIVRCPLPPTNYSAAAELRVIKEKAAAVEAEGRGADDVSVHSWDMVAYEAVLGGDTAVVFV